jgi:hypothetical protein
MKKGIQNMKQFMNEQTTLGLTPATASYYDLSDIRAAAQATRTAASRKFRELCGSPALAGLWPPVLIAASDAQWRSGAVWGS